MLCHCKNNYKFAPKCHPEVCREMKDTTETEYGEETETDLLPKICKSRVCNWSKEFGMECQMRDCQKFTGELVRLQIDDLVML